MPSLDDNEVEVISSDTSQILDDAADQSSADAASSTADGDTSDDLLSVAQSVIKEQRQEEAASPAEGEEEPETEAEAEPARKEPDDENFSDVPFHKHPRFKKLLNERNGFREDATRYRNVQAFLDNNGLSAEEGAEALVIAGLMRTNPQEAWKRLQPIVQNVLQAAGEILPQDLHELVVSGQMSQQAAFEVSRARAAMTIGQSQRELDQQRQQRAIEREAGVATVNTVHTWESERRTKDPNFDAKYPFIQREIAYYHATEGKPNRPDLIRAQLDKAYRSVSATFRSRTAQPAPQPKPAIKPVMGGQAVNSSRPEPKTTLDLIRAHRNG